MYKLTVELKQQTPLIHFQHDQYGATLRASEVKPKLDRFILTQLGKGNYNNGVEQAKINGWLIGSGDHHALNYKMRIEGSGNTEEYLLVASYIKKQVIEDLKKKGITAISDTPFFAQEKQNSEIIRGNLDFGIIGKKGLKENNKLTIKIVTTNKNLAERTSSLIQPFFSVFNFGTRQSKGFGGFSPTSIMLEGNEIKLEDVESLLKQYFKFVYKKTIGEPSVSAIMTTINRDYRLIKSGLTRPYAKSKLMLYVDTLDSSNVGWDKKFIKNKTQGKFISETGSIYELKCNPKNRKSAYDKKESYQYFRALLGLAEQFEFLLENPPRNNKKNMMIVKVRNNDIQRYQSPLLFKVFDNNIYLVGNDVAPEMLNVPFQFLVNFQNDDRYQNKPLLLDDNSQIKTPCTFSLSKFISFAMKNDTNNAILGYTKIKE